MGDFSVTVEKLVFGLEMNKVITLIIKTIKLC